MFDEGKMYAQLLEYDKERAKALKEFKAKHYLCTTRNYGYTLKEYMYNGRVYCEEEIEALWEAGAL